MSDEQSVWRVFRVKDVPRMTFIHPDGHEMPNLPADAYHLQRYLKRGFRPKTEAPLVQTIKQGG